MNNMDWKTFLDLMNQGLLVYGKTTYTKDTLGNQVMMREIVYKVPDDVQANIDAILDNNNITKDNNANS